jgi:predicted amidohydrolase YtcJ
MDSSFLAPGACTKPQGVDRIFINAKAYTLDENQPWADAIAVRADTIVYVGDNDGTLEVGKKADLVVLDSNLFELDAYEIHNTKVLLTVMDGDVVYEAGMP